LQVFAYDGKKDEKKADKFFEIIKKKRTQQQGKRKNGRSAAAFPAAGWKSGVQDRFCAKKRLTGNIRHDSLFLRKS